MPAVQTQHADLLGVNHLAVADADDRIVASCASSCRLVSLGIAEDDELPLVGASEPMSSAPGALVASTTHIFVLAGHEVRKYSNVQAPVFSVSADRIDDNNRWIDLVGSAYVIYPNGENLVIAARTDLSTVASIFSGLGRIWSGIYDASSGYAFLFSEFAVDCAIVQVDASTGELAIKNIVTLSHSNPIEAAVIAGTNLHFITRAGARLQTWDITTPEDPVRVSQVSFAGLELRGLAAITDTTLYLATNKRVDASNDEFDYTPYSHPIFHSGRIFVPEPEPGRVWSSTFQLVWDTETEEFGMVDN